MKLSVFFISDSTGLSAEKLGNSILTQFDDLEVESQTLAFINDEKKANHAVDLINAQAQHAGQRPVVFITLANAVIRDIIEKSQGLVLDLFTPYVIKLEDELHLSSTQAIGKSHRVADYENYDKRIAAIHYALEVDDGLGETKYDKADVIIVGVSRAGKTPTCLYLAVQFGVFAANYPITEEDLGNHQLPKALMPYQKKIFGLTIATDRLQLIREKRQPNSRYASLTQCEKEISTVERLFNQYHIPSLDVTQLSIEEIATKILVKLGLRR